MASAQTPQNNAVPDRSQVPAISSPESVKIPPIVKRQLSNGIPVWFTQRTNTPMATVAMFIKAGAVGEASDKMGTASLTADLLDEGTKKYTAMSFSEHVDDIGAYFSAEQAYFGNTVSITVPAKRLDAAVDLMSEALLQPTFPQEEIDRLKKQTLTGFMQKRSEPSALAGNAFMYKIYENDPQNRQRYGVNGTAQTYASITRDDIVKFYRDYYTPANTFVAVTGNVDVDKTMALLEETFGKWQAAGKTAEAKPKKTQLDIAAEFKNGLGRAAGLSESLKAPQAKVINAPGRIIYVVDRPGSPQSVLRVGCVGYARSTEHFFPLRVMNTVLGGSFMSRLNQNLRERNGYTYGARSAFVFRVEPGPFAVMADVQSDKTVPALREVFSEIENMGKKIPEDELKRTRNYICYGYPQSFETSGKLAGRILEMKLYELPDDYYDTYVQNIESVDNKSMSVPRQLFFQPNRMEAIVVGDAKAIEKQIKEQTSWKMVLLPVDTFMGPEVAP
ncbi:insulinase family protein [bacterium]|nr:insulinase family protein [bacterium]